MSDSLAPDEDLAPEEARDLESLLSGRAGVPGRQSAAAVLAALRAAPAPGELDGEAAALTAFRLFVLPEGDWPTRWGDEAVPVPEALAGLDPPSVLPVPDVPPPAPLSAPVSLTATTHGLGPASGPAPARGTPSPLTVTRPLTVMPPLPQTRSPAGPRHRRSRRVGRGRPPAALLGAGSVAAVLVVVLCLLLIPGGGPTGHGPGAASETASTSASGTGAKPQLQGDGASERSPSPAASRSPASQPHTTTGPDSPAALCRQYVALFGHYGLPAGRESAMRIFEQLSADLGGREKVAVYCFSVIDPGEAHPGPVSPWPVSPGPANPDQWQPLPGEGQPPGGGSVSHGGFGPGSRKAAAAASR